MLDKAFRNLDDTLRKDEDLVRKQGNFEASCAGDKVSNVSKLNHVK